MSQGWMRFHPSIWRSRAWKKLRKKPDLLKAWLWLTFNEDAKDVGIYRPNVGYLGADCGIGDDEAAEAAIAALATEVPWSVKWHAESGYVWVVNAVKYQHDEAVKPGDKRLQSKEIEARLEAASKSPFWSDFLEKYREHAIGMIACGEIGKEESRAARAARAVGFIGNPPQALPHAHGEGYVSASEVLPKPLGSPPQALPKPSPSPPPPACEGAPLPIRTDPNPSRRPSVPAPAPAPAPDANAHVALPVPTERTNAEEASPFSDVPHTLADDESALAAEADAAPDAKPTNEGGSRSGPALGSPKAGAPTNQETRKAHPNAGMGSTRPRPLVDAAMWKAATVDQRAAMLGTAYDPAPDFAEVLVPLRAAVDDVAEAYAAAVEAAGFMARDTLFDAIGRAVAFLADRKTPAEARDLLLRLVAWAPANADKVGKLYRGIPAWAEPWALFGAPAGNAKWRATGDRLPESLNIMGATKGPPVLTVEAEDRLNELFDAIDAAVAAGNSEEAAMARSRYQEFKRETEQKLGVADINYATPERHLRLVPSVAA